MDSFLRFRVNDILNSDANFTDIKILYGLLKNGLELNEAIDKEGSTPLHLAAGIFEEEISLLAVKALLNHSANPNYPDNEGKTSMHVAALLGHKKVLELLICNGGNILQSSLMGDSSIDLANRMEQHKVVSYLSFLLDTEEYEIPTKESFISFLWNRQLVEITEDLSSKNLPSTLYSIYEEDFVSKDDSIDYSNSYRKDFNESTCQFKSLTFIQKSKCDYINLLNHRFQNLELNPYLHNETFEANKVYDKTNLLDVGFVESKFDYSQNLFDTSMDNSKVISIIDPSNGSKTQDYFTPLTSLNQTLDALSSLNQTLDGDSFITVVEDYVYKDEEKGIELIERRFPSSLVISRFSASDQSSFYTLNEFQSNSESSTLIKEESIETLTSSIKNLSGKALRKKLKELGFDCGPVIPSTIRTLQRFYLRSRHKSKEQINDDENTCRRYSKELERLCNNFQSDKNCYEDLEDKMAEPFLNPDPLSWWRNGIHKTSFNYLLLDPRITKNLPLRPKFPVSFEEFRIFLSAIFYIGKGSKTRPYAHLYEALKQHSKYSENKKLRKIQEIWEDDLGVISLHVFQCTIPAEAWTREASMISAYGLHNLTNSVQGTFYGPASTWRKTDQKKLGTFCLFQAFHIYLFEGERQIRPKNLTHLK